MKPIVIIASAVIAWSTSFGPAAAAPRKDKDKDRETAVVPSSAPTTFAPVPEGHPLASLWNDPEFVRRLLGSYGFASDAEPRMTPEEQGVYRDKVVPLLREDPAKAAELLATLVKPSATAVFDFTLGNIAFQHEDLTNAVKHFEAALAKFPDYRRAQKNLAFALVRDGKFREAIGPLTRTAASGGGDGKVFGLLGFAYMNQARFVSAQGAYEQALVFEPENTEYRLALIKSAVGAANYDRALALLDELIQQHPERDSLWTLHANILIQKEQPAKAAVSLEILRRLGKATAQNLFLLGDIYMTQEARDLALSAYLDGIEADRGQNPAKALRPAQILVGRGAYAEAKQLIARIRSGAALPPEDELKLLKLEVKVALADGEGPRAIESLERIAQKNPLDGEALLLAGDYYSRNGEREKAEFRYQAAAGIQGFEADAYVKHAQLLVQSQKYPRAVELLRKAQKAKPRDNVQRYLDRVEQLSRSGHQ